MSEVDHSTCKSLLGFLSDYVDGDLSEELCREIENHAAECQNCRVVVDTLRKTISLYHDSAAEPEEISGQTREKLFKTLKLEDYLERSGVDEHNIPDQSSHV
jgi:predicted anti-sigma-YlaC factor YlaD